MLQFSVVIAATSLSAACEVNCNCNKNMSQAFLFPTLKNPEVKKSELCLNKCNRGVFNFLYGGKYCC